LQLLTTPALVRTHCGAPLEAAHQGSCMTHRRPGSSATQISSCMITCNPLICTVHRCSVPTFSGLSDSSTRAHIDLERWMMPGHPAGGAAVVGLGQKRSLGSLPSGPAEAWRPCCGGKRGSELIDNWANGCCYEHALRRPQIVPAKPLGETPWQMTPGRVQDIFVQRSLNTL